MTSRMRVRYDPLFVSGLLFTVTLLFLVPDLLRDAAYPKDVLLQTVGFASLANILVGLVVVWTGLIRGCRWAWTVMFIIVWVWAFPALLLPLFHGKIVVTLAEWLQEAWHWPGSARIYGENVILFSIMLIALVLPVKSFFWKSKRSD